MKKLLLLLVLSIPSLALADVVFPYLTEFVNDETIYA